ncbi:hypothetical protein AALO_G00042940 [Alosa alosa]|uniref:C-type lectin domain-containing protein n=1 Tax=Alosa alosa TaxID=278164 RepID=A0AAV6HBI1_9TELE|nr:hypothetical protein AALO_G00042940 [Alosa alosa]
MANNGYKQSHKHKPGAKSTNKNRSKSHKISTGQYRDEDFFLLSLTLTVALGVPVPELVPMDLPQEEAVPRLAAILPVQGHVVQADVKPDAEQVQEEVHKEVQPKEDVLDENVSDLKESLSANRLPVMEEKYIVSDEPVMRSEFPVEEETVVQEVHPEPRRPGLVEEPRMELIAEEEEGMYGKLTEEEDEMAEVPEMVLEPLPKEEPVEDGAGTETDLLDPRLRLVEEPTIELEPLFGEELTSADEPGSETVPGEEEELMGEEGPVMPGEMVVEEEESPGQEPIMDIDPDEEPVPWARSGLAEGPLMDGMTVKQAMMEEEPDMWVGPGVMRERHMQNMEEEPEMWARTDEDAAAMAREMDMDNEILVGMESSDGEQARPYAEDVRPMDGEFPNAVYTKRGSCSGAIIDGRCHQFFRGPKEAADAEFFCQNNFPNGHLASVTNPYIHQQMMNLMAQNGGYTRTWVGGLKYLKTGRFIWLDGAHWGYADWLPGKPNDTIGVEDCIELLSNGKFNDMPCWDLRAYICSYPL